MNRNTVTMLVTIPVFAIGIFFGALFIADHQASKTLKAETDLTDHYQYLFSPYINYYSMTNRVETINSKWGVDGGSHINNTNFFINHVSLGKKDLFVEAWLEFKNNKPYSNIYCDHDKVCISSINSTIFLIIQVEDKSIKINSKGLLDSNPRILEIKNITSSENFDNALLIKIDTSSEIKNYDRGNVIPTMTIFVPVEFTDPCIFSNDYVTCQINQKIEKNLEEINRKLGI